MAYESSEFSAETPAFETVLQVRAGRQAMMRDFLAGVTAGDLACSRNNPHAPAHEETILSCLHTILEEEWEHHRYAARDLDTLAAEQLAPAEEPNPSLVARSKSPWPRASADHVQMRDSVKCRQPTVISS